MKDYLKKEVDDLRIVPYVDDEKLPALVRDVLQVAQTDGERDMLLVSLLTAVSACLPNRYFRYGRVGKVYRANLQTFIMANAASGKGICNEVLKLVQPIHEQQPLLIPGDSTYAAFFRTLRAQDGVGYMHESEGSVITDIWRSGTANYNTALRKAAEHEPISRSRVGQGMQVIVQPRLSCLLTGTFDQFRALVPGVENGFFSRLLVLVVRQQEHFRSDVFCSVSGACDERQEEALASCRRQLLDNYLYWYCDADREFRLTAVQARVAGTYFHEQHHALLEELGGAFHPTVVRMGVMLVRVAMILSLLRDRDALVCRDDDFRTALLICSKLLLHASDAFQQIGGEKTMEVGTPSRQLQQKAYLASLSAEFTTASCLEQAELIGVSTRTAYRWLDSWVEQGIVMKRQHGLYEKAA